MKVVFISHNNVRTELDVPAGTSLMQAAVNSNVHGIAADCGGCCSCATCHVYVQVPYADRLEAMSEQEDGMLENTISERLPNSRLSCQIKLTEALDGLTVNMPSTQH